MKEGVINNYILKMYYKVKKVKRLNCEIQKYFRKFNKYIVSPSFLSKKHLCFCSEGFPYNLNKDVSPSSGSGQASLRVEFILSERRESKGFATQG